MAEAGFVLPLVRNLSAGQGGEGIYAASDKKGIFVLGTGSHAVTVIDGNYFDAWDSGKETPVYYFEKEN